MNNKVTILTATALASVFLAHNVNADEVVKPQNAPEQPVTAKVDNNNTTEPVKPNIEQSTVSKEGTEISVQNPNVTVEQPEGNGRYTPFKVKYEDVKIPDDIPVNEGDKVTFDLPDVVKFQTSYEFDVHNPEKAVIGKATADATANKVTTVFNDYFKTHPLNKSMSLELDATWTDKVEPGKPVTANFNGTVVTATVGEEGVIGKDELVTKWGEQDKEDPTVINWTARVNYARRVLNHVSIIDTMSENQKLVDNYFEVKNIESLNPWIDKGDAMDLVKSISKSDHGFEIKMDRLDHMIYMYYKTKLTNSVAESTNPTNKIELKAEDADSVAYQKIQLVGGKGDAIGENKPEPTFEIPNDAPKVDKPSINIEDIPKMPPAPILDKPYLPIEDVPLMPPAPVLDKPELKIPNTPERPKETPKPKTPAPKTEIPNVPTPKVEKPSVTPKAEEVKYTINNDKTYQAAAALPQTSEESTLLLSLVGIGLLGSAYYLVKKADDEE